MGIQEEIHKTMQEIQEKLRVNQNLNEDDLTKLLMVALIEEEGQS